MSQSLHHSPATFRNAERLFASAQERGLDTNALRRVRLPLIRGSYIGLGCDAVEEAFAKPHFEQGSDFYDVGMKEVAKEDYLGLWFEPVGLRGLMNDEGHAFLDTGVDVSTLFVRAYRNGPLELYVTIGDMDPYQVQASTDVASTFAGHCNAALFQRIER